MCRIIRGRAITFGCLLVMLVLLPGCVSDRMPQIAWPNPFQRSGVEDPAFRQTTAGKIAELEQLVEQAGHMSPAEQMRVATDLAQQLQKADEIPLRVAMVEALGAMSAPIAIDGLQFALQDSEPQVRQAACRALADRQDEAALQLLAGVLASDPDIDVRITAAQVLGQFRGAQAVLALGSALDSPDPALQYVAVQSLRQVHTEDAGNDLSNWKQVVADLRNGRSDEALANRPSP